MTDECKDARTATMLMRMALALLDKAGETDAACHLQHAISRMEGEQPLRDGEDIAPELIEKHLGSPQRPRH